MIKFTWFVGLFVVISIPAFAGNDCQNQSRFVKLDGSSLSPLYQSGAQIRMHPFKCSLKVQNGDIVVFKTGAHEKPVAKIVKAIPKDRVDITKNGQIMVNDHVLKNSEGYVYQFTMHKQNILRLYIKEFANIMPADHYLLLGDQITGGLDSSRIGFVHETDMLLIEVE